jgi:hypothetical protein
MRTIKSVLLNIFMWFFWHHFLHGLKTVLGHKTLSASIKEMNDIELFIRKENGLLQTDKITWDNSKATKREIFAKYVTLRHFNEVGELLAFFKSVEKKKILGGN